MRGAIKTDKTCNNYKELSVDSKIYWEDKHEKRLDIIRKVIKRREAKKMKKKKQVTKLVLKRNA